jgi:hypothetical protein
MLHFALFEASRLSSIYVTEYKPSPPKDWNPVSLFDVTEEFHLRKRGLWSLLLISSCAVAFAQDGRPTAVQAQEFIRITGLTGSIFFR